MKVRLQNDFGANSPFVAVGNAEKISSISFDITKTYQTVQGINTIHSVDFNYRLQYVRADKKEIKVETKAVLFAYDYGDQFILPFFDKKYRLNDYQGINLAPYNSTFWNSDSEFKLLANESEKKLFIESDSTNLIDKFSYNPVNREISFNKPTYRKWSLNRLRLNNVKGNSLANRALNVYLKYNLDVKIYMNINPIDDTVQVELVTILDPFTSYSNLEINANSAAFINMYFDLIETKRRELEAKIRKNFSAEEIETLYKETNEEIVSLSRDFFTETAGGTNRKGMTDWNEYIYSRLQINNLQLFRVTFKY